MLKKGYSLVYTEEKLRRGAVNLELHRCYGCMELTDQAVCPRCGWSAGHNNALHQLRVGTLLKGQYLVGRVLGQGGFGITYLGWDTVLDAPVAIKEFYPRELVTRDHHQSDSVMVYTNQMGPAFVSGRERILREAKALAKLRDIPQIVGVQNCFNANGTAYIVMEYVRGMDLVHYVQSKGGRLTMKETFAILEPVMIALEKVHRQGLVHRDISPDNIMLDMEGNTRVLDFGAVRSVEAPDEEKDLTQSTEAIVKHGFTPMEQYRSRGSLGPWTDEYALCATIWYCLTGNPPPDALSLSMEDEALSRANVPGLTEDQWAALKRGMSPKAKDRFGDLSLLRQALQPTGRGSSGGNGKKKKAWPIVAALLAVVLLGAGAFGYFYMNDRLPAQLGGFIGGTTPVSDTLPTTEATEPSTEATEPPTTEAPATEATEPPTTEAPATEATEPPTEESQAPTRAPEAWEANVLAEDPFAIMGLSREGITGVEFRSKTTGAPKKTYDISRDSDGSVLGWVENGSVIIAGKGGVNGVDACSYLFSDCVRLKKVSFGGNFHTEQVTDMSYMFCRCPVLESVDTENLDTSCVVTMEGMFNMHNMDGNTTVYTPDGNHVLRALDTSTWDVSKVENMSYMFYYCNLLGTLGCADWDTSSVTDMSWMFACCTEMLQVDVDLWQTGSVEDFSYMFFSCGSMNRLDIADWDVSQAKDMQHMFDGCSGVRTLDVENWNTGKVENMSYLFGGCKTLEGAAIGGWDVSSLKDASYMFSGALRSGDFDLSGWNTANLRNVAHMFDTYYRGITLKGISSWNRKNLIGYETRYESFAPWGIIVDGEDWQVWFKKS